MHLMFGFLRTAWFHRYLQILPRTRSFHTAPTGCTGERSTIGSLGFEKIQKAYQVLHVNVITDVRRTIYRMQLENVTAMPDERGSGGLIQPERIGYTTETIFSDFFLSLC